MQTRRSLRTLGQTLGRNESLWLLLALAATFAVICPPAYAQGCADCATNALGEDTVSSGEWLLTKQVNEVSVIFVAARNGKAVGDLSLADISVRDDDKAPTAILGFRTEQSLPLRVGVAIDTSNSLTSRFRFEQDAASAFFHQAVNRDSDLGFVMGFENHATVTQDFVADSELLSQGVGRLKPGGGTALYDAVRALRPAWLMRRGPTTLMPQNEGALIVYVDGHRFGNAESLRQFVPTGVNSVRYFSPTDAEARFGPGHLHGAIEVITSTH